MKKAISLTDRIILKSTRAKARAVNSKEGMLRSLKELNINFNDMCFTIKGKVASNGVKYTNKL